MPFVARNPGEYRGQSVGNGHCVHFVRAAAALPPTSQWTQGRAVWAEPELPAGTAIATFGKSGRYENKTDGSSHAAILIETREDGIWVWDQWVERPVSERFILAHGGEGHSNVDPCDDADAYCVIEIDGS